MKANPLKYWLGKKRPSLFSEKWKKEQSERLKGHYVSPETRRRISEMNKGRFGKNHPASEEKHPSWKGEDVGYMALHSWVRRRKGKPSRCEDCGKDGFKGKQIHWANKDHSYKRNLEDWLRLCSDCHRKYDIKRGLV